MVGFGLALLPGSAVAQQKTLKEQLVGTWMLVSAEVTPPTGAKRQDFGANAKGILVFDAGGRYAAIVGDSDRPKFKTTTDIRLNTPAAELGEAARQFAANFGTWSVNEADNFLTRKIEIALVPNNNGAEIKNSVTLAGDELKISAASGGGVITDVVYRRAK